MKKIIKAFKFPFTLLFVFLCLMACDKDFSVLESDVLGEENSRFKTDTVSFQIAAYNKNIEGVQINSLSSNLLGVYNDPAYGQTIASIITQLTPASVSPAPDFGVNPVIDSVIVTIPYFSRTTGTDTAGNTTYTILDSLYGKKPNEAIKPFKLSIYENKYFLRSFNPSGTLGETQRYYSKADGTINTTDNFALNGNSTINFDNHIGETIFSGEVTPSSNSIRLDTKNTEGTVVTEYVAPALRLKLLNTAFWKTTIIEKQDNIVLSNLDNFNNYFRGLYFKTEALGTDGSMVLLNLASTGANITIYYSKDTDVAGVKTQATYVLRFFGNTLNTFINNYNSTYKTAIANVNNTIGDEKLYLKGQEGSMAVVDLFSGMVDYTDNNGITTSIPALEAFKKTYRTTLPNGEYKKDTFGNYVLKRLINDAQLIVTEDPLMPTFGVDENDDAYHKYDRVYAFDIENNRPLIDYYSQTLNTTVPYFSNAFHLGLRFTNDSNISKYKIHLTEHLNNILISDLTNTKIGLVMSNNVNIISNALLLNSPDDITAVPTTSVILPRGSIMYGTGTNVPSNRKMKLKVFYSESK